PGRERGQVRARVRLGEALGPELVEAGDARKEALLLLVGTTRQQGAGRQPVPDDVHERGVAVGELLRQDEALGERPAEPAVLHRPGEADPALLTDLAGEVEGELP